MPLQRHYLGSRPVDPQGWINTDIVIDFESDMEPVINLGSVEFLGEDAVFVMQDMVNNGYFEGRPYRVDLSDANGNFTTLEAYLDYSDDPIIKGPDQVEVKLKRKQGSDWFAEVAETAVFRYMASDDYTGDGKILDSDYFSVPYVINYIPDGVQLLILSISTFSLTKELVESIQSIAEQAADISTNAVPTTGTSVGLGAGVVTAWDLGDIIAAAIKLAITVAYTVGIVIAIIKLIEQIVEQLAPKKRFHKGIPIRVLFQRSCEFLNLELSSELLDFLDRDVQKWVLIPRKGNKGGLPPTGIKKADFTEVGYPTSADGLDNFAQVIQVFQRVFNAHFVINNGVLEFERRDFWQQNSSFVIPNTFTNQEAARNETSVNTNELKANYVIGWNTDTQDQNTLDDTRGLTVQVVTSPTNVSNPELVNLKGKTDINVPFSMATRKNEFTAIEKALQVFLDAADFLTGQLGKSQSFGAQFSARVGSMHLSSHFLSIPKMVVMNGDKLATNQRTILSAKALWDNYHYIQSFVDIQGKNDSNNQQKIYTDQTIPLSLENFLSLLNTRYATTEDGRKAEIKRISWEEETSLANISYNVYDVYDTNLEINVLE